MSAHIQQAGLFSGRHMTFMVVVGLHAVVISALIAMRIVPDAAKVVDILPITPITPVKKNDPLPPDPHPLPVARQPIEFIPQVIPTIRLPDATAITTIQTPEFPTVPVDPAATGVPGERPATRVATDLQYRMVRQPNDYYPNASVMLDEQGVAIVRVCSDTTGRISAQPTIQTSSGYKLLDQAAVRWASESLRFVPATVDGVAIASCKGFRVVFDLK